MPFYQALSNNTSAGKRTLQRILQLRQQLDEEIPQKTAEKTLLLATWNIREFDSAAYGDRIAEAFYYIAEIVASFDLIAVQEVRQDLTALNKLMSILGGNWSVIFTDVTEGAKGNGERMAFIYDKRKVRFGGLMGELVLPPIIVKDDRGNKIEQPATQVVRTPLMCGFKVGWTDFILTTVHILYGEDKANNVERVEEISQIAKFLKRRSEDKNEWSRNLILLGDFNIYDTSDLTMKAMTDQGFSIPEGLQNIPSNAIKTKYYDQIAFKVRPGKFGSTGKAGVFDFYKTVFRPEDELLYIEEMGQSYQVKSNGKPRTN
jgi:endonuclease/exonuclease/phosphatase family metal-dependent hydrolase